MSLTTSGSMSLTTSRISKSEVRFTVSVAELLMVSPSTSFRINAGEPLVFCAPVKQNLLAPATIKPLQKRLDAYIFLYIFEHRNIYHLILRDNILKNILNILNKGVTG